MPTQAVRSRLALEIAKRAGALTADEENAMAALRADATATRYRTADVVALIAAVAALQAAYTGGTDLIDVGVTMTAATAAAVAATAGASSGGV